MNIKAQRMRLTYGYNPEGIIDIDIADTVEGSDYGLKLSFYGSFSHFIVLAHKDDLHRQTIITYPNAAYMDEWIQRHPEAEIVMRWPTPPADMGVTVPTEGEAKHEQF